MWSTTCIVSPLRTKAHSKTYFFFKRFFRVTLKCDLRLVIRIYWMCCFNKKSCGFAFTLTRWGTKQAQVNVKHNLHSATTQNESSFENLLFLQEIFRLTLKHNLHSATTQCESSFENLLFLQEIFRVTLKCDLRLVIRIYWMCCFNKKKVVGLHLRWCVEERNRRK